MSSTAPLTAASSNLSDYDATILAREIRKKAFRSRQRELANAMIDIRGIYKRDKKLPPRQPGVSRLRQRLEKVLEANKRADALAFQDPDHTGPMSMVLSMDIHAETKDPTPSFKSAHRAEPAPKAEHILKVQKDQNGVDDNSEAKRRQRANLSRRVPRHKNGMMKEDWEILQSTRAAMLVNEKPKADIPELPDEHFVCQKPIGIPHQGSGSNDGISQSTVRPLDLDANAMRQTLALSHSIMAPIPEANSSLDGPDPQSSHAPLQLTLPQSADPVKASIIARMEAYELFYLGIPTSSTKKLTFETIPWPTPFAPHTVDEIDHQKVTAFLMSAISFLSPTPTRAMLDSDPDLSRTSIERLLRIVHSQESLFSHPPPHVYATQIHVRAVTLPKSRKEQEEARFCAHVLCVAIAALRKWRADVVEESLIPRVEEEEYDVVREGAQRTFKALCIVVKGILEIYVPEAA